MSFLINLKAKMKSPGVYIPVLIIVFSAGIFSVKTYQTKNKPPEYETTTVQRGYLVQTVEATGKLESKDDVSLRFEVPGTLVVLNVKEGAEVKAGQLLASLRLSELNASVAQASANLRQKQAGATDQDREYYRAAVDAAKATLEQTKIDAYADVEIAGAAVNTAYNNLRLAEGGDNSHIVNQAYESGTATLQLTIAKLEDAINQGRNAIDYLAVIPVTDSANKWDADSSFIISVNAVNAAKLATAKLNIASPKTEIDTGFSMTEPALSSTIESLAKIAHLLDNREPFSNSVNQAVLDKQKTAVAAARSAITTQYASFIAQRQELDNAKNSYTTYSIAYKKAEQDLADAKAKVTTTIRIKQAVYDQAIANYNSKILPTRPVDLAPYQAALAGAVANREKAILRAPTNGIVAKIGKKKGEFVSSADIMIQMISPHFEIKVDVPEMDIPKIVSSTRREATFTLDAFGEETVFSGVITNINKKSTEIQDVVYYQITVSVNDDNNAKPVRAGMTANVKIVSDARENALYIPQRILRTRENGEKYVIVLDGNNREQEKNIAVGLRADEGKIEVLSGIEEGQTIIIGPKKK